MQKKASNKTLFFKSILNEESVTNLITIQSYRQNKYSNLVNALQELHNSSEILKIKIYFDEKEFEITPVNQSENIFLAKKTKQNREKYNSLSPKEVSILCFLFKGYKQAQIAFILNITINTYRHHKKHLYKKMEFTTKYDLNKWCIIYLDRFFRYYRPTLNYQS